MFLLFSLISVNSLYLLVVRLTENLAGLALQDSVYQYMFLIHLILGVLLIAPLLIYGAIHIKNAYKRPNRRAVKAGFALFFCALALLLSGLTLTRGIPLIELRSPVSRDLAYWSHLGAWFLVIWLFVLHRLAGRRISWRAGLSTVAAGVVFTLGVLTLQNWSAPDRNGTIPSDAKNRFFPSLARTVGGGYIQEQDLMNDGYCAECHADVHAQWSKSMHRFASFNNPVYRFAVLNTRKFSLARDGNTHRSRFCAGCHDPVPLFSGAFDEPGFDLGSRPSAEAGITCSVCHSITKINSPRGNADFTIEAPQKYPFAGSGNATLRWVNRMLIKANPEFHRKTFLKPLHRSAEFCGLCHKVHLPEAVNGYRWLRGQNHYDSFLLSGVSGHGLLSFYYPEAAEPSCNGCHMPRAVSDDFGATPDPTGTLSVHDHLFAGGNTAIPHLLGFSEQVNARHRKMLQGSVRVDIFGFREGLAIDGRLLGPTGSDQVELKPGKGYLIEVVVRTLTLGHSLTQGTADSNELWLELTVKSGDRIIGQSGNIDPEDGSLDPLAHRINVYMLDREGNRIDRRNAEEIFTRLYDHQIPPGAADVIHYSLNFAEPLNKPLTITAKVKYRKFDTELMKHLQGGDFVKNQLPIMVLDQDTVQLGGRDAAGQDIELWERWNDYGIGLLRAGQLRQAQHAFEEVARMGRGLGYLNLARTFIRDGQLNEAGNALEMAGIGEYPAYPWAIAYWTGELNWQNGFVAQAIERWTEVEQTRFSEARRRGFDFRRDYRLLDRLGQAWLESSRILESKDARVSALERAISYFERALALDPERSESHYALAQAYRIQGDPIAARRHLSLHERYRIDDNARDEAIAKARAMNEYADHAANRIRIYPLSPAAEGN